MVKSKEQWRDILTDEQFQVCRCGGTEAPFSGRYYNSYNAGTYHCVCCGAALFDSAAKYDSGTGWPSFTRPMERPRLIYKSDFSHGMQRTEVRCADCDAHLGHVFPDGPNGGERYCINSVALRHEESREESREESIEKVADGTAQHAADGS